MNIFNNINEVISVGQIPANSLICADCLEAMKYIADNSIDMIITSPPYNLGNSHHTGNKRHQSYEDNLPEQEYQEWQIRVLKECYRILKDSGSMIYNHKNRIKNGVQISPYEWIFKTPFIIKQELVWFNGSQNFDKIRFYPMTERIYWLVKNKETKLYNAINHHDLFNTKEWQPVGTNKEHKRTFPENMVEDFLKCFPLAQIILDPFIGSGTTAIACIKENRKWIGIELEMDYIDIAEKRINNEKAKLKLF